MGRSLFAVTAPGSSNMSKQHHHRPSRSYELTIDRLRIFEGDSEIFNFTAKNEGLLHESPPALHSMLPIVAWPISSNKFLLAHFRSGDERIIQKLKPFSPSGKYNYTYRFGSLEDSPSTRPQDFGLHKIL